ncbi:MAG: cobalamin-dependent protein [Bacteroidetes bacterium]|nr:cobalamin-dependent protein [Bacteroidota bacterium]
MKILLINTPRSPFNGILQYAPEEAKPFIHKKLIGPPLGLLTLAAAVKDYEVIVFDTKAEYDLFPDTPELKKLVEKLIIEHQPDIVGTTVITSELYYGKEILQTVKSINPNITTIIGGQYVNIRLEECYDKDIDIAIQGHGGQKLREISLAKEKGMSLKNIPGIHINNGVGFEKTQGVEKAWDAAGENFIMPDRKLLERWRQAYRVQSAPSPTTYLYTSLGCPFKCTFCSIWKENCGAYYKRNIHSIIEELISIDYDIVRFADANTIVDISFIDELFSQIEKHGIKKEYIMDIRADVAVNNPKLIEKLAKNGLKVVICGFESYKEAELNKYNKSSSASYIEQAIELFHDNGIMLRGNYVIPTNYTPEDFKAMSDYAGQHKVAYAGYTVLTPMPGTDYYDEVKNDIIDKDLRKYNFFNAVLPTYLPLEEFYREVGSLWLIRKGKDVI